MWGGGAAEDCIINLKVGDLSSRARIIASLCFICSILNWYVKVLSKGLFKFCLLTEPEGEEPQRLKGPDSQELSRRSVTSCLFYLIYSKTSK